MSAELVGAPFGGVNGPLVLAGASFGAQVAFEMARQLEAAGARVGALRLLDPAAPARDPYDGPPRQRVPSRLETAQWIATALGREIELTAATGPLAALARAFVGGDADAAIKTFLDGARSDHDPGAGTATASPGASRRLLVR